MVTIHNTLDPLGYPREFPVDDFITYYQNKKYDMVGIISGQ